MRAKGPPFGEALTALLETARVMGDFADLKSIYLAGHSTTVEALTMGAAERLKLDPAECLMLHTAALAHDLGRVTVSAVIWDKPGPLNVEPAVGARR